jgi:hypothetical protein
LFENWTRLKLEKLTNLCDKKVFELGDYIFKQVCGVWYVGCVCGVVCVCVGCGVWCVCVWDMCVGCVCVWCVCGMWGVVCVWNMIVFTLLYRTEHPPPPPAILNIKISTRDFYSTEIPSNRNSALILKREFLFHLL